MEKDAKVKKAVEPSKVSELVNSRDSLGPGLSLSITKAVHLVSLQSELEASLDLQTRSEITLYTKHGLELNQTSYSLMESALGDMNHHIYVSITLLFSFETHILFFLNCIWITELENSQSELILLDFNALH